jgi:adenylosuccinate lyase
MHERYLVPQISKLWSDEHTLELWQEVEFKVIRVSEELHLFPKGVFANMIAILRNLPIDIPWWKAKDKELHHDLNAFLAERVRHLPLELQEFFHKKMTSYDTEEPAFTLKLKDSYTYVVEEIQLLLEILKELAVRYRYTIMYAHTHGQGAELQTFGKRCLTWYRDLVEDLKLLNQASEKLNYSKLSGAIGNYGSISPEVENRALALLGLEPYYGATQIMPRELYAPLAESLAQIVSTLNKIAIAIRLGARSGNPIFHEPFKKTQMGSSAMPHKKNTILTEKIEGMERMAHGYLKMIMDNIKTWEERAIEQSCVERVAWPDLFHVTIHSLRTMNQVLSGLRVYPDNMLKEILESHGCYASSEAKEVLLKYGATYGLSREDCYRIIQLAAFNVFPENNNNSFQLCQSLTEADAQILGKHSIYFSPPALDIKSVIEMGGLKVRDCLDISQEKVNSWNESLNEMFTDQKIIAEWNQIFLPSYLLKNESKLYKEILGVD